MDQNIEDAALKLVENMKKKGTQIQSIRIGNQIIKIMVQPEPQEDRSLELSQIDHNESYTQSFSKDSLIKQQTSKKISLGGNTEQTEPPNSFMNNLFFDEEMDQPQQQLEYFQKQHPDINQHFNILLNSHPESKMHIQAILQKLQEVETENKERKKKQQQLSLILSTSINNSQNFFESSSNLFSLQKLSSDPLCRLVSSHLRSFQQVSMVPTSQKPSLLFLYSQPLVYQTNDNDQKAFTMLIDYQKQQSNIRNILSECKIGYIRQNASNDKLASWLQSGVQFIHFCGHGARGTDQNSNSDYLVFQNSDGGSYNLSSKQLKQLLKKMKKSLKFVFVASCHSKQIGQVFLSAGVQHVICVRREEKILDQACQEFVKNFYISCFNNNQTICQAFEFAKLQVSHLGFPKGEQHKFVMLKPKSQIDDHTCQHFVTQKYGEFKDLTLKPLYSSSIPSRVQNFIPRPKLMADVISAICKNRFVTLKGIPGMGKSTLGRQIVRYINFRNKFKDGVIYIQLLGCQNIEGFFHSLYGWLFQGSAVKYKTNYKENIERIVQQLKDKHTLIYLDNCDALFGSNDKGIFKTSIESILQNCNQVYFLFTCRIRLGEILNSYEIDSCTEKVITLDKLDLEDSKKLFLAKVPNPQQIKQEKINQFIKAAKITDLKFHPLFQFLNGHPQAICMSASLLDGRSLKQVYQLLANQSLAEVIVSDQKKGYNAFRISLEVSWNIIKRRASECGNQGEKEAAQMFKIMGMLPAGLDKQTMPKVFGTKWRQAVKILQKYSLLKQTEKGSTKYYSIYPHMMIFAEGQLQRYQKKLYHQKLCEQLQRRLFQKVYKNVGTGSNLAEAAAELYFYQQNNYKACIFRQYENLGCPQKLRTLYSNLLNQDYEQSDLSETNSLTSRTSSRSKFKIDALKKNNYDDTFSQSSMDQKKPIRHQMVSKSRSPYKDKGFMKPNLNTTVNIKRRDPPSILRLIIFQGTVLFILKNFLSCEKIVSYGRELAERMKSPLAQANLIRILACISLYRRNQTRARDLFGKSLQLFANIGCGLGVASCQAALGYIRHIQQQYAQAKKNLQNALKYYDQIPHIFGKHYLNRWLLTIKTKINRGQNQLITHNEEALKLLKETKIALKGNKIDSFQLKHKAGFFAFRFMFDNISLFLECAFQIDVRPTKRITNSIKNQGALFKTILPIENPKKVVLENELLPVAEVGQDQRSFIESQTKIKNVKISDKDREKQRQIRDLHKKKMSKPPVITKQSIKELKQSGSKEYLLNRQRTQSQHASKKDWK